MNKRVSTLSILAAGLRASVSAAALTAAAVAAAGVASAQTSSAQTSSPKTAPASQVPAPASAPVPPAAAAPATMLDAIAVFGDFGRRGISVGETTAGTSVIDDRELEKRGVHRLQDLPRYEPGVAVGNSPARAGAGGFAIRGITRNRILMQIDGTRLPETPASAGPSAGYNRDTVDFDALKQIEIVRGPASALYGSDALGGVVTYVTKDPSDYLKPGKDVFASLKGMYDSVDNSFSETATGAVRAGEFSLLGVYTRRDGDEYRSQDKTYRNPQDYDVNNGLAKLVWERGVDRVALTGEYFNRDTSTTLKNDVGTAGSYIFSMAPPRIARTAVTDSVSDDEAKRWRITLDHAHNAPIGFIDGLEWRVYATGFERSEDRTRTGRVTSSTSTLAQAGQFIREETRNKSEQTIVGAALNMHSKTTLFGAPNHFSYGLSVDRIHTERMRDVTLTNAATGATAKSYNGDSYPSRTFPVSDTLMAAAYVQDEITLGALRLVPALRLDYYRMTPEIDAAYLASNPPTQPSEIDKLALSPKFGVTYDLTKQYSLFGQYAHGFRAPPYDDANLGFSNPTYGYETLPNGQLKPESSDGFEAGLRGRYDDGSSFQVSAFYNRYTDFIAQKYIGRSSTGLMQYQAQNLSEVEIFGLEGKGEWRFQPGWRLFGAFAFARGFDKETDTHLDDVAPFTLSAGLGYDAPDDLWGAQVAATHVAAKDDVSDATYFKAPNYAVVDLAAYYNPTENLSLGAAVNNLFDQNYYNYINVTGLSATSNDRRRYLEAGRSFMVQATVKW